MLKEYMNLFNDNLWNYKLLEERLLSYNQEHGTDYEITHNGLELWVHLKSKQDMNVIELIKTSGFKSPNFYGNNEESMGHLLWMEN